MEEEGVKENLDFLSKFLFNFLKLRGKKIVQKLIESCDRDCCDFCNVRYYGNFGFKIGCLN
jgi:hypothetical protein